MALPIVQQPVFEVYLKSLDKKVKFRPFLVKEEKLLLIARESNDDDASLNAIKQVIQNCLIEPPKTKKPIDVNALPLFDIQMLFTHLRMKSVGESVALEFTCTNLVDEETECGQENTYNLDLTKVKYEVAPGHSRTIQINDKVGVTLRYPTMSSKLAESEDLLDDSLKLIIEHLELVFDEDGVYDTFTPEEVEEFVSSLSSDQLDKILNFFITAPKVILEDTAVCKKCKNEHKIYAEDLYSFFI
jgi:hypothetical protein